MSVRINPSILSADFVNLERDLARIASADYVHVDVMDNHFVPNLTFGPQMVQRIQETSPIPLDVHLMISDADRWAPGYAELGCFSVTFHLEAARDPVSIARDIRARGARAGVAIKPGTPEDALVEILSAFDQVLVMTVEPGFAGQSFIPDVLPKVTRLSSAIARQGVDVWLQVDGGVNDDTISEAARAGADTFVAGSSVFGRENPALAIASLRSAAEAHSH